MFVIKIKNAELEEFITKTYSTTCPYYYLECTTASGIIKEVCSVLGIVEKETLVIPEEYLLEFFNLIAVLAQKVTSRLIEYDFVDNVFYYTHSQFKLERQYKK